MSLLQKAYIQKSRIFLLPLTGIKKDRIYRPLNTYISSPTLISKDYPEGISIQDEILILTYSKDYELNENNSINKLKLNNPVNNWEKFETDILMSNRNFTGFYESKDEYIYTFDLSDWSKDWTNFIIGSYSNFSLEAKKRIMDFRWKSLRADEQKKLYCYLYPSQDECIRSFARELSSNPRNLEETVNLLKEAKELCSKPDLKLENYIYDSKIEIENLITNES